MDGLNQKLEAAILERNLRSLLDCLDYMRFHLGMNYQACWRRGYIVTGISLPDWDMLIVLAEAAEPRFNACEGNA